MMTDTESDIELSRMDQARDEHLRSTHEAEKDKRKDFEDVLRKALKEDNFSCISDKVTPKALTKCETNALFMSMEVSFELRRLADRKLPNVEDVTKLAVSVEEFTTCLIDPLKSDSSLELRSKFQLWFDEVMETAIEFEQKKFFVHPVIDNMKNDFWYRELGHMWTPSYWTIGRWKWIFLDFWCLFDLVLFPFVFAILFLVSCFDFKYGSNEKDPYEMYQDYFTTPYFIFVRDTLSYLILLGLHFAICLSPTSIKLTGAEWAVMVFFMGRTAMEIKQLINIYKRKQRILRHVVANKRQRLKESLKIYARNSWNRLDLVNLLVYACTFVLRVATSSATEVDSRALLVGGYFYGLNTMILTFRVFGQVMETVKGLGTIQIALFSIISDVATIFWQFAATILAFSFAITKVFMSEKSIMSEGLDADQPVCSNSGLSCWWTLVKHLLWSLLGIVELNPLESIDRPTETLAKVLYAVYLLVAAILLINMMIALLSNTYQRVEDNSLKEWTFKKAITDQTYKYLHPVPVPLNLVSSLFMAFYWLICCSCCRKRRRRCIYSRRPSFLDVVEKLQHRYLETYGDSFPLTEEEKMEKILVEMEGNRRITNQIAQRGFTTHPDLPAGPKAWQSMGLKVNDCLLVYEGPEHCTTCQANRQSPLTPVYHGARYVVPFTKTLRTFEVLVLDIGNSRRLDVGVVQEKHDLHTRPGLQTRSIGYQADGFIFRAGELIPSTTRVPEITATDVPVMKRGDLISCSVSTSMSGEVSLVFSLNGKQVTDECYITCDPSEESKVYPYIGMGEEGFQVLARMIPDNGRNEAERLASEEKSFQDTLRKLPDTKASADTKEAVIRELDDDLAKFRELRNKLLDNFRSLEHLFDNRHRELMKLAEGEGSEDESNE